jgi:DNA replication protein DnaC
MSTNRCVCGSRLRSSRHGIAPMGKRAQQDLLEVIDDRVNASLIAITSQFPISVWHAYLGEPTIADAILDRIVHTAHRVQLQGESMRKLKNSVR